MFLFRENDPENPYKSMIVGHLLNVLSQMPDDFYEEDRTDEPPQERETI
ncbi:hypothetical protein I6M90_17670 [Acinetobacter bereziniae]|nr:hypothetical protein [Acinetobacter bereziniae]MBJ8453750.1 hypothetical protein [Acinetobacter bereziniae]MBJ8457874.1 hypothetical protein [Acinetobacter bereziniae]